MVAKCEPDNIASFPGKCGVELVIYLKQFLQSTANSNKTDYNLQPGTAELPLSKLGVADFHPSQPTAAELNPSQLGIGELPPSQPRVAVVLLSQPGTVEFLHSILKPPSSRHLSLELRAPSILAWNRQAPSS